MAQGKFWCFTDYELRTDYSFLGASYVIYGVEVCPETGNTHHQGYCEFETNQRLSALKKKGPNTFHWEKRMGTQDEAIDYCKKDGNFVEFGTKKANKQGARTDIDEVKKLVKEGKGMREIVDVATSYQSIKYAETLLKYTEKRRDWVPEVYWYWGPTGTGKTRTAFEESEGKAWMSLKNGKWWEGYDAHEDVIFDDFRGDFCTLHELLRILDRYPYVVEVKGGSRQLLARRIWITSPYEPTEVYKNITEENIDQLLRRITKIKYFGMGSGMEVGGNTSPDPIPVEDGTVL